MPDYAVVGKGLPKLDASGKAIGRSQYVADMSFPNMLHGKVLRSPYAHANVLNVDASQALKLKGVKAVLTPKDILPVKYGIVPFAADQYALCIDKVRHIGDSVAAVAAIDEDTAEEALSLIKVDYEILPAVFDPEEAMKPGAPVIHEGVENNTSVRLVKNFGDVDAGFAESDIIREDRYRTQPNNHAPMEPHGCISIWHPENKVTIWCSTQIPFFLRRNLAKAVGLEERDVRVIKTTVGGGFGGKLDMYASDLCATLLSRMTCRPVRIIIGREEVFLSTRQRHPMTIVATAISDELEVLCHESAVPFGPGLDHNSHGMTLAGRKEDLLPAYRDSHRAASHPGKQRGAHVGSIHIQLPAEASPDYGLDHPHIPLLQPHRLGQIPAQEERYLRGAP
ncbi:MAG TPA: molybdopterin cofactor-binding domain-containing protein, partial [Dehalococcoidia bacterium]|nr:molybdopterin cofactor-binding domain-containing protein [Dehalococcoidia bacterium]